VEDPEILQHALEVCLADRAVVVDVVHAEIAGQLLDLER